MRQDNRATRRNNGTHEPVISTYRPYMTKPPKIRYAVGNMKNKAGDVIPNGTVLSVQQRKQPKVYPAGWRSENEKAAAWVARLDAALQLAA